MYSPVLPPKSLLFLVVSFACLAFVPKSVLGADDERYTNCSRRFDCGNIRDIHYPFWGSDRPDYCGYPDPVFKLSCAEQLAEITIMSATYRVLQINNESQTLTVARADYLDNLCPTHFINTTLDTSLLQYTSDSQNITLYYRCPNISITFTGISSQFSCDINETSIIGYYITSSLSGSGLDPLANGISSLGTCNNSVSLRMFQSNIRRVEATPRPTAENLVEFLGNGFGLQWSANNSACTTCQESGGLCGNNPEESGAFSCYCLAQPYPDACPPGSSPDSGTKKNSVSLGVGLGIAGAAITGIFLGIWGYSIAQRRKRNAEQSKSKDLPTDMPPTPLSKGLTTPSTNLSQSTPSFLSSKSDLEKGSTYFGIQVFSYTELEEATDNFNPSKELGEGGFGVVYYGLLKDGREVAVKRLYENNFKRVEQFKNEIKILADIRHVNLVTLYGCTSRHSRELLLVYEYIPNGTVADHLHGKLSNSGLLTWPVRLSIAMETANALAYLHAKDIIHRDVKTNNILLDNNFRVKVADFGLSRLFPNDVTHVSTAPQGTPGYVDPEYYQCYQLTDKSDVYSFGVVLMELVSSKQAVDTNRHRHDINLANMAINRIQNHALHELVDPSLGFENDYATRRMTTTMAELAFRCLQQERDMRPSMEEVLGILRGIQNEGLGAEKAEVVDIRSEDMGLLKHIPPPLSPDSSATEKWMQIRSM